MSDKSKPKDSSKPEKEDDSSNKELRTNLPKELKTDSLHKKVRKPVISFYDQPSTSTNTLPKRSFQDEVQERGTRFPNSKAIWPLKNNLFRAKYTPKRINFLEPVISQPSSEESVVTINETAKHGQSGLRSSSSKSSLSVRTFLPSSLGWENQVIYSTKVFKLGNWEVAYEVDSAKPESCMESFRGLMRTRICRITMCFLFGIILPLILVISAYLCRDFLNESNGTQVEMEREVSPFKKWDEFWTFWVLIISRIFGVYQFNDFCKLNKFCLPFIIGARASDGGDLLEFLIMSLRISTRNPEEGPGLLRHWFDEQGIYFLFAWIWIDFQNWNWWHSKCFIFGFINFFQRYQT